MSRYRIYLPKQNLFLRPSGGDNDYNITVGDCLCLTNSMSITVFAIDPYKSLGVMDLACALYHNYPDAAVFFVYLYISTIKITRKFLTQQSQHFKASTTACGYMSCKISVEFASQPSHSERVLAVFRRTP